MRLSLSTAVGCAMLALTATPRLHAQQTGRWDVRPGGYIDPENVVNTGDEAVAVAQLDRLIDFVRRVPVLARPAGADLVTARVVEHYPNSDAAPRAGLVRSHLRVAFHALMPNGQRESHFIGEITIRINPASEFPGTRLIGRDSAGPMYRFDSPGATTASWPTWIGRELRTSAWHRAVLITPPGVQVHVPVTKERWLRHQLGEAAAASASFGSADGRCIQWRAEAPQRAEALRVGIAALANTDSAAARRMQEDMARLERETAQAICSPTGAGVAAAGQIGARVDSLRRELQALSTAERQAPVWLDMQHMRMVPPGSPGAAAVVAVNPALYSPATGAAPHVILVEFSAGQPRIVPIIEQAFREWDWATLADMLRGGGGRSRDH